MQIYQYCMRRDHNVCTEAKKKNNNKIERSMCGDENFSYELATFHMVCSYYN